MGNTDRNQQWVLTEEGLLELSTSILEVVNQRIESSIVTEINEESDDEHVPSARAVYEAINATPHATTQIIRGSVDENVPVDERDGSTIYIQADEDSDVWSLYFWNTEAEEWIWIGEREVDLSGIDLENYWSKDDEDNAELRNLLGIDDIIDRVNNLENEVEDLEAGVVDAISDDEIDLIIDQAIRDSIDDLYDDPVEPGEEEQDPDNSDPNNPDTEPDPNDEIAG